MEATGTAALVTAVLILSEVVKAVGGRLARYLNGRGARSNDAGPLGFNSVDRANLERLTEWHGRIDTDGVPLAYIPRRWGKVLESIDNKLGELIRVTKKGANNG